MLACAALAVGLVPAQAQTVITLTDSGGLGVGLSFAANGSGGLTFEPGCGSADCYVSGSAVSGSVAADDYTMFLTPSTSLLASGNGTFTANPAQLTGTLLELENGTTTNFLGPLASLSFSQVPGWQGGFVEMQFTATGATAAETGTNTYSGMTATGSAIVSLQNSESLVTLSGSPSGSAEYGSIVPAAAPVPEPASAWLYALGVLPIAGVLRRRRNACG